MENDLRTLLIKMTQTLQEYEVRAKSLFMVVDALKNMSADERAQMTPQNISQMQEQAHRQAYPVVAESARPLLLALQGESDFLRALEIYLGL